MRGGDGYLRFEFCKYGVLLPGTSLRILARTKQRYACTSFFYTDEASKQKVLKITFAGQCTDAAEKEYNILVFAAVIQEAHTLCTCCVDSMRGQKMVASR
ncbi:unnamed protein product [Prorocentrum cordatum]|uniref:Uncharacterized protein n=1 Tax=Prorocentrum cordatum TaxID=2364126 RepID=A0ABN9UUD8_9DINO|nr:unnamed protein product [Polarella glacialis]|mmetsp:Transcript_126594/g.339659  ORF Transcript_126594/g.339659 Transcript_126594/m.339659 type:complete len:100 (+) Transcript_126594:509-808(+)